MTTHPSAIRWLFAGLALNSLIVVWTCTPILDNPRLRPDDYRYLQQLQPPERPEAGPRTKQPDPVLTDGAIVENRWDHLWWIDVGEIVRFYRPVVQASYALDAALWTDGTRAGHGRLARGLLIGNIVMHGLCAMLLLCLLLRFYGPGWPALITSVLYTALFCHGESIYYVAGRTDTLAAMGVLAALTLHLESAVAGKHRWILGWLAVPCFGFALLSKELVVGLPVVLWLFDRAMDPAGESLFAKAWSVRKRRPDLLKVLIDALNSTWRLRGRLWVAYLVTIVVVTGLRFSALGTISTPMPYPYFVTPSHPEFLAHLWTAARVYAENMFAAQQTPPFLVPENLGRFTTLTGFIVSIAGVGALASTLRDRRAAPFVALGAMSLLATAPVYVSERYLDLPSIGLVGLVALLLHQLWAHPRARVVGVMVVCTWIAHQGYWLHEKHMAVANRLPEQSEIVSATFESVAKDIPAGAEVLVLNAPVNWVGAQFLEQQLRVLKHDPRLRVHILTVMPVTGAFGAATHVKLRDTTLRLTGDPIAGERGYRHVVMNRGRDTFPRKSLDTGAKYLIPGTGLDVRVVSGAGSRAAALEFGLKSATTYYVLRWQPLQGHDLKLIERLQGAKVTVTKLDIP